MTESNKITSFVLIDNVAEDAVLAILNNLRGRSGFDVLDEMHQYEFTSMVRELKQGIVIPALHRVAHTHIPG